MPTEFFNRIGRKRTFKVSCVARMRLEQQHCRRNPVDVPPLTLIPAAIRAVEALAIWYRSAWDSMPVESGHRCSSSLLDPNSGNQWIV